MARKIAFMLFLVWSLFLSGLLDRTFSSPGVIQALELRSLLAEKQNQVAGLEAELRQLEEQFQHLEKNDAAIEREIRKTLGYAASDELVFDFGASVRKSRDSVQPEEDAASPRRLGDRGREGRGGQSLGLRPLQDALLPVSGRVERKLRHSL